MRHRWRSLPYILLFLFTFPCALAWAQESAPILPWSQVEEAISSHPIFRSSQEDLAIANGEVRVSRQYPNPDLDISLGAADPRGRGGREFVWDLELTIPLEWPGAFIHRSHSAKHGVEAAKHDAQASRLEVWRQLRSLYLTVAFDQEKLRVLSEAETERLRFVEAVQVRVEQGEARPVELSRAQAEFEEHRIALNTAKSGAAIHLRQLNLWLGDRLPAVFRVEENLGTLGDLPSLEEALHTALGNHPSLKAAKAATRQAEASAVAERHAAVPSLAMGGFYGKELDSTNYGGLIRVGIPLWNWNLGGIAKADAQKRRAQVQIDLKTREIRETIIAAQARAHAALDAVRRFRDYLLPASERAYRDTERLYASGETDLTDLLDVRRAHLRTQEAYLAELLNFHLAMLDLSVSMGRTPHV